MAITKGVGDVGPRTSASGDNTPGTLHRLVGSGDRIALFVLPFLVAGVVLNIAYPSKFDVGGPSPALWIVSLVVLVAGATVWAWSAALILTRVPRGELITSGPYALVKHPLYTAVALLVVPWIGFLADTWLGVPLGLVLYAGARLFGPAEEAALSRTFGGEWEQYRDNVKIRWL